MVEFNGEGVLGTNRSHILDLVVLQRRDDFINSFEEYRFSCLENSSDTRQKLFRLKSRLQAIFLELDCLLQRRVNEKEHELTYIDLKKQINKAESEEEIINSFYIINNILDKLNITRIDTKRLIDFTDIEAVNTDKGL